jgi:hypothetical protein
VAVIGDSDAGRLVVTIEGREVMGVVEAPGRQSAGCAGGPGGDGQGDRLAGVLEQEQAVLGGERRDPLQAGRGAEAVGQAHHAGPRADRPA